MSKALELIRTLIDGANEYEKETGNKNPTVYLSRNNLLVIEQALLKAQEPKKYLKWEDLEFKEEEQTMKVLLNGTEYILSYFTDGIYKYIDLLTDNMRYSMGRYVDCYSCEKQFFNDLRLERVEE